MDSRDENKSLALSKRHGLATGGLFMEANSRRHGFNACNCAIAGHVKVDHHGSER